MTYNFLIPAHLQAPEHRGPFLSWLRLVPISFHQRLRIYFDYLDLHQATYTTEEIDSLKDEVPVNAFKTPD